MPSFLAPILTGLQQIASFIQQYSAFATLVVAIVGVIAVAVEVRSDRRQQRTYTAENRRLSEVNIKISHRFTFIPQIQRKEILDDIIDSGTRAYATFQLPLENIGDGPVDILGALISARQMPNDLLSGIGTRSRDVEWSDYIRLAWDNKTSHMLFSGISTTKNMIGSPDQYVRLAPSEHGNLRRVDAVNNTSILSARQSKHVSLMYRAFIVARGYPLGEILRQLGGGPPDPIRNVRKELLQFQSLAQPNYFRWRTVQQAILNLNRFVFRLAIYDDTPEEVRQDPLGYLAEPDAWRIFLLHHWEFIDELDASPEDLPPPLKRTGRPSTKEQSTIMNVTLRVRGFDEKGEPLQDNEEGRWYPNLVIPDDWQESQDSLDTFNAAKKYCHAKLSHLVDAWKQMCRTIELCKIYKSDAVKARYKEYPDEGYVALIHGDAYFSAFPDISKLDYAKRWLALRQESYLVSKPFEPGNRLTRILNFRAFRSALVQLARRMGRPATYRLYKSDIPKDPRVLEPYVIRTYYYLVNITEPDPITFLEQDDTDMQ